MRAEAAAEADVAGEAPEAERRAEPTAEGDDTALESDPEADERLRLQRSLGLAPRPRPAYAGTVAPPEIADLGRLGGLEDKIPRRFPPNPSGVIGRKCMARIGFPIRASGLPRNCAQSGWGLGGPAERGMRSE